MNIGYSSKHARRRRRHHCRIYARSERSEQTNSAAARLHYIEGNGISYIESPKVFGGWAWQVTAAAQWRRLLRPLRLRPLRLRCLRRGCPRDAGCRRRGSAGSGGAGSRGAVRLQNCAASFFVRSWGVFFMISGIAGKFFFSPMTLKASNQP